MIREFKKPKDLWGVEARLLRLPNSEWAFVEPDDHYDFDLLEEGLWSNIHLLNAQIDVLKAEIEELKAEMGRK